MTQRHYRQPKALASQRPILPRTCIICLVSLLYITLAPAKSDARERSILPMAGIGWTVGGDSVDPTPRENPSSGILNLDDEITSGGEFHIWFGAIWVINPSIETFFAAGYHNDELEFSSYDSATGFRSGGSANFGQITYEIIPTYRVGQYRFAAGFAYHVNVTYSLTTTLTPPAGTTTVVTEETKFREALGNIISFGYDFNDRGRVDLRYQFIDYEVDKSEGSVLLPGQQFNANSVGLYIYVTF